MVSHELLKGADANGYPNDVWTVQRVAEVIEWLPGYAPDLNPIQNVWGNLKSQELANLCSHTIDQVADIAEGGLDRIGSDAALCRFPLSLRLVSVSQLCAGNYPNVF